MAVSWFLQLLIAVVQLLLFGVALDTAGRRLRYEQGGRRASLAEWVSQFSLKILVGLCVMVNAVIPVLIQLNALP